MPRIELDLERDLGPKKPAAAVVPTQQTWQGPQVQFVSPEASRIGSDTARKTAGAIYLLQSLFFGALCFLPDAERDGVQWLLGLIAAFFFVIGLSLVRGSGFIEKIILWISYLRVGVNSILFLLAIVHPGKALISSAVTLVSSVGLIVLLSGKSLTKPVYFIATTVVLLTSFIYR